MSEKIKSICPVCLFGPNEINFQQEAAFLYDGQCTVCRQEKPVWDDAFLVALFYCIMPKSRAHAIPDSIIDSIVSHGI